MNQIFPFRQPDLCDSMLINVCNFTFGRYEKAMDILEERMPSTVMDHMRYKEIKYTLLSNMAVCYLNLDQPDKVIEVCELALEHGMPPPKDAKVYYR
jgi:hypothetical protein